ncbi:hypothetical protein [Pseudoramibacter faecis]|uniref:hypothetical protein n=1 Tax=Pseudoramibacter faecis TaxID=3108534 RepID=UPI002E773E27|nr:hypothetical protein [Pseudoramibacter sp. HA2172]
MAPLKLNTRSVHGERGRNAQNPYGAISVAIFQTAAFALPGIDQSTEFDCTCQTNPTRVALKQVVSALEGAAETRCRR